MMKSVSAALLFLFLCVLTSRSYSQTIGCRTVEVNPINKKSLHVDAIDSAGNRGMADNYYLWDRGATLKVRFLNGSKAVQDRIIPVAKQWEKYAGIKFEFVKSGPADIRIRLSKGEGHYSYMGTYAKAINPNKHTLCLDTMGLKSATELNRVVVHEFGHAIGLMHEHESPISGIKWNKEKLYEEYERSQGWSRAEVDQQVFSTYNKSYTNGTKYDPKSIMHYPIDSEETLDGYSVPWNTTLSKGDKELIGNLYPKKRKRKKKYEVTRVSVANFAKLDIIPNDSKGGISLFPSFDMTASGKKGKAIILAEFYDSEGYPLPDLDGKYKYNDQVSAIRTVRALPRKKMVSYNKGKNDFEIFIPYDQLDGLGPKDDMYVSFRVVVESEHGEIKDIYNGNLRSFSRVKKP